MTNKQASAIAVVHLGYYGRLVDASKSAYRKKYPDHLTVFNSNVCTKEHGKIWFGDIDVTLSEKTLNALANELGCTVYVLREMDGRFENAKEPLFLNAVYKANFTKEN